MKKLLALLLALVMVLSLFAACGSSVDDDEDDKKESTSEEKKEEEKEEEEEEEKEEEPAKKDDAEDAVAAYVNENGDALAETLAASVGAECEVDVESEDCGIVITISMTGWDNIAKEAKEQVQELYDSAAATYSALMDLARAELPELEFMTFNVCEEDGDLVATLTIE